METALPQRSGEELLQAAAAGDRRALAQAISAVERGGPLGDAVGAQAHRAARATYTVGITGAPGAGKSTLGDSLLACARGDDERIAVLAVDPSSPFSGGAILGDRVRLRERHSTDDAVFVRSLSNRGHLGGLAQAVPDVVRVLDHAGWPWVLIETVGVGQAEVEIAGQADTTIVVVTPGAGDDVQANKAGLMEIADILVLNKMDRPGAQEAAKHLHGMLALSAPRDWRPPILRTQAETGAGVLELWQAIGAHRAHLTSRGELERMRAGRQVAELRRRVADDVLRSVAAAERTEAGRTLIEAVGSGRMAPAAAARELRALMAAQDGG